MEFNMTQMQENLTQMQKTASKFWKSTMQMMKMMAQIHNQNNINYTRTAQYLQAVGGVFNAMAQYESQMNQFYSGQTKP